MDNWYDYLRCEKRPIKDQSTANDSYWLYHRSLAKKISLNPFLLVNEWVSAQIAWHMGLPIPPFAMMRKGGSPRFFASLDFGGGEELPPDDVDAKAVVEFMPCEATGITLYDILIANPDRHAKNLHVDVVDLPTRLEIFDHERGLFGHSKKNHGVARLQHVWDRLGLCKGLGESNFHKLGPLLKSAEHFQRWYDQIYCIPDLFIDRICTEAQVLGFSQSDTGDLATFLKHRKRNISVLVNNNRAFFKSISSWGIV